MLKRITFLLLFLIAAAGFAQKTLLKEFDADLFETIKIESDNIFLVNVTSKKADKIILLAKIQGETFENVVLEISEEDKILGIKTGFSPYFKAKNDKLAAHKVISIELTLIVPINFSVEVRSTLARVMTTGPFTNLSVELENGSCFIENFTGNAKLQTMNGDINVYANEGVGATGISEHGKVANKLPTTGDYMITAESRDGTIRLLQTK